jgi:Putative neutral zinc metallopeptidase.
MKWHGSNGGENIEDRRGMSGRQVVASGGLFAVIALVIGLIVGGDPQEILSNFF